MTEYEKLFNDNYDYIFKYLMKLSKNSSLAEELTQETFYRAYMNYGGLRNKDKAKTWLCQIAKNLYYKWYNENKKTVSMKEFPNDNETERLEDVFIKKELSEKTLRCLHELEEPYREVFMLYVFGGFSLKDISCLFDKSESWARVIFYRAKQKILGKL